MPVFKGKGTKMTELLGCFFHANTTFHWLIGWAETNKPLPCETHGTVVCQFNEGLDG
jgi:hypothetical protein